MAKFFNPVKMFFGVGELKKLSEIIESSGGKKDKKLLLLTGAYSLKKSGRLAEITSQLKEYDWSLFDQIPSNPDVEDLFRLKEKTDACEYNFIIAVGGGSVIDAGKSLAAFNGLKIHSPQDIRKTINENDYRDKNYINCPILAVPTTAGTGSEVTSWATVWDKQENLKYSIEHSTLYPEIAIVDPELTLNLTAEMTAASALDAISHAMEAYWSKNTNEIVRMYALKAIENIAKNLEALLNNPEDLELRSKIAYGSLFAGLAFSNTKTTACHSISYPLTLMFGINHGVAVSLTLGKMLLKNEKSLIKKDDLLGAYGVSHVEEVEEFIQKILDKAGLGSRLRDYGVSDSDLSEIADKSFTPGRMDNNPVDIDRQFLFELLETIY